MATEYIQRGERIVHKGESFRFYVPGGYSAVHYASCGGNCKMASISDIGNNLDTAKQATLDRLDELFSVCKKLLFQVNVCEPAHILALKERFTMVSLTIIPIGYNRPGVKRDKLTYLATFLTNNNFHSSGVTQEVVEQRMQDPEIKRQIKNQTISLKLKK